MTLAVGLEVILAAVFATSAVLKARSFPTFVTPLRSPFGRFAPAVAAAVVATESLLALGFVAAALQVASPRPFGMGASIFLILASAFIAYRLVATDSPACGCFGGRAEPDSLHLGGRRGEQAGAVRMLLPGAYAIRNGALFVAALALAPPVPVNHLAVPATMVSFLVSPLLILAGLVGSIGLQYWQLSRPEHPLADFYAPRLEPLVALGWYSERSRPTRRASPHPTSDGRKEDKL
ncbi:MAG: MauE/DoxX family redox-associated membrane protein [Chloroflexota bacterium]